MHFLFFAFLISHIFCLDCYQGTNNDFSIVTCPNVDDSCISAFLSTGGLPSWNISEVDGMGTRVYACGNCGLYQFALNNTVVHSVSCCNSPLCNTITGPVPSVGCDSITSQALCTSDPGLSFSLKLVSLRNL